jgi:hypothetical protein
MNDIDQDYIDILYPLRNVRHCMKPIENHMVLPQTELEHKAEVRAERFNETFDKILDEYERNPKSFLATLPRPTLLDLLNDILKEYDE